jgi:Ca2+-dependent lipid-binding protein
MSVLHSLHRLRQHARRESELSLRRAQEERDVQAARVDALRASVAEARDAVDPNDASELSAYHAWRLRAEMTERRESVRLAQRERDLDQTTKVHQDNVRKELSLERVIDEHAVRELEEARRVEGRAMDEIASRRRAE